jgi:hypothetical protein
MSEKRLRLHPTYGICMENHDREGRYILEKSMNHTGWKFALALLALGASFTAAGEEPGIHFSHGDWEIACDNTLTCRMAGYSAEDAAIGERGSVLIARAVGPNTSLVGVVTLANGPLTNDADKEAAFVPPAVTLYIDKQSWGTLELWVEESQYQLTPAQIQALLTAARADGIVRFEGKSKGKIASFTLSGKGVSAVMLKMDEVQGRIGTPGALIRKGEKPEESVYSPLPAPEIRAAKVSGEPPRALSAREVSVLKPLLRIEEVGCAFDEPTRTSLDARHVLISALCLGDEEGHAYWVMDSALKEPPKFVAKAREYSDATGAGIITSGVSMSESGDCYSGAAWVWDGQEFRKIAQWTTGIRRGGAWHLPTFITKIVNEDGSPHDLDGPPHDPD